MKKFISGLIIGALLSGTVAFAASNLTAVKSTFTTTVNGKKVSQSVVTIKDAYYADMKQMASNLGVKYSMDTKNKKISLGEAPVTNNYNMKNPAPIGTTQTITSYDKTTMNVTLKEIERGAEAWELIKEADPVAEYTSLPEEGYEYLVAKINFKLVSITDNRSYLVSGSDFQLVSDKGKTYDYASIVGPDPSLNTELYKGASNEGWVVFKVKVDDEKPLITFGRNYDGTGGIWFKAY